MIKVLDAVLLAVIILHLFAAPYTKVEESFTIQAIHDMLNYGVYPPHVLQQYDHTEFPGVVPRTFVGTFFVAACVRATDVVWSWATGASFITDKTHAQLHVQIAARAVLGAANFVGIVLVRRSLVKALADRGRGRLLGMFYTLMFVSQFHVAFYASRPLPNFVVLPFVNYGLSKLVAGEISGLSWLALCGAVFRLEVGVFAAVIAAVSSLVFGQSNVFHNAAFLIVPAALGCFVSSNVDSYFWRTPVLPELAAFHYNVVAGNAANWGVEPYAAYFTKYIVNFFRPPHVLFLGLFGLITDPTQRSSRAQNSLRVLAVSALVFVAVMSLLPHKEWRFIVYTIPVFNAVAANGLAHLWTRRMRLAVHRVLLALMLASTAVSFVFTCFMSYASSYNYPGGQAVAWVNEHVRARRFDAPVVVHVDVPACMTGVTRFTQLHDGSVVYDKTESVAALAVIWNDVDVLVTPKDLRYTAAADFVEPAPENWRELTQIPAFAGIRRASFVRHTVALLKSLLLRTAFARAVLAELCACRADTLRLYLQEALVLRPYLRVYERVRKDVLREVRDSPSDVEPVMSVEDVDPEAVKT